MMPPKKHNAPVQLFPFQKQWLEDTSRFKLYEKSRQIGISFTTALEVVLSCLAARVTEVVLSKGERQSGEFMEHVQAHAKAVKAGVEFLEIPFWCEGEGLAARALQVTFPNGSRMIGLPANPDTARGYSGNLTLDEFAIHRDARAIWKACFPIVSRNGRRLRVISTHNGKDSFFYELCTGQSVAWSRHRTDIYDAVREGYPQKIEELKDAINDPDTWQEEFECIPLDGASNWLGNDLITRAEDEGYIEEGDVTRRDAPPFPAADRWLGVDVGRKKDLTAIWLIEDIGNIHWTRSVEVMRNRRFAEQADRLAWYMDVYGCRRCCIDATGLGAQLAEQMVERFGSRCEAVTFTGAVKEDLAVTTRRVFEDGLIRLPVSRDLRADLRSVKRFTTSAGNIRFDAERTELGHADRFWSLALALHAAKGAADNFIGIMPVGASPEKSRRTA